MGRDRRFHLPSWDKPSFACLASRFVYGERITEEKLHMVDAAEELLRSLGFAQFRVRIHGRMARIEVLPEQIASLASDEIRRKIAGALHALGLSGGRPAGGEGTVRVRLNRSIYTEAYSMIHYGR